MENLIESPVTPIASSKGNKWTREYVDNSPECNPISYEFLPQKGLSSKGESSPGVSTPVAKKKRKSFKNSESSPISNMQHRLLPPPPSEKLEDLKKFTNIYKSILCGIGDDEVCETANSEDTERDSTNMTGTVGAISSDSYKSSSASSVSQQYKIKKSKTPVRNRPSSSKQSDTSPARFRNREPTCKETTKPTVEEISDEVNYIETSYSILDWLDDEVKYDEASYSLLNWLDDLKLNEILLLNDGNDDGFTCIDDNTLSFLCSGSQSTPVDVPINVPEKKCQRGINKVSVSNKYTAQEIEIKRREAMKRLLERRKSNSQIHSQKVS